MKAEVPDGSATASALIERVRTAVSIDASDIHIENYMGDVDVNCVDGVRRHLFSHQPKQHRYRDQPPQSDVQLDITERRLPQDGPFG